MEKEKRIYKYPTGAVIPEGAIYLKTVTQTEVADNKMEHGVCVGYTWGKCWLVWHYFLVEVSKNKPTNNPN